MIRRDVNGTNIDRAFARGLRRRIVVNVTRKYRNLARHREHRVARDGGGSGSAGGAA